MAQPEQAQPTSEPQAPVAGAPDEVMVNAFQLKVQQVPGGRRFLTLHHINRREVLMLDLNDDAAAERLAGEIKPSRVARVGPNGNGAGVLL